MEQRLQRKRRYIRRWIKGKERVGNEDGTFPVSCCHLTH